MRRSIAAMVLALAAAAAQADPLILTYHGVLETFERWDGGQWVDSLDTLSGRAVRGEIIIAESIYTRVCSHPGDDSRCIRDATEWLYDTYASRLATRDFRFSPDLAFACANGVTCDWYDEHWYSREFPTIHCQGGGPCENPYDRWELERGDSADTALLGNAALIHTWTGESPPTTTYANIFVNLTGSDWIPEGPMSLGSLAGLGGGVKGTGSFYESVTDRSADAQIGGMQGTFRIESVRVTVPEPSSLLLLGLGLAGVAVARRRRQ